MSDTRQAQTRDIGLAIRDCLEGQTFSIFRNVIDDVDSALETDEIEESGDLAHAEVIDCSDPDNLIVLLDNGQRFTVRIVAGA